MSQSNEKVESASAALEGASVDKEEGKEKITKLLKQLNENRDDDNENMSEEDMDEDDITSTKMNKNADVTNALGLTEEGLLGTEIAEEIEKALDDSQKGILKEIKRLQIQHFFINKSYEDELQRIKFKYEKLYKPLYIKRKDLLISGVQSAALKNEEETKKTQGTPYLPGYWLSCLKRHRSLDELIEEHDEMILGYLSDIRCEYVYKEKSSEKYECIEDVHDDEDEEDKKRRDEIRINRVNMIDDLSPCLDNEKTLKSLSSSSSSSSYESFRLIFEFIENPFFSPNVLTKEYHLTSPHPPEKKKKDKKDGDKKKDKNDDDNDNDTKNKENDDAKKSGVKTENIDDKNNENDDDKKNTGDDSTTDDKKKKEGEGDEDDENEKSLLSEALPLCQLLDKNVNDDELNKNLLILSDGNTAELEKTVSTIIQWKDGKDPTKKIIFKKQRNRRTKQTRTVQETILNDSFFNFFSNHTLPNQQDLDKMTQRQAAELQMVVEADYDIGVVIRDRIIPESVTWFLGLAMESEDDIEEEEEEDDYEESENDSDDDEDKRKGNRNKNN